MASGISHTAVVTGVSADAVTVEILTGTACSGCRVAVVCGQTGERVTHTIEVDNPAAYSVGQRVDITATDASQWRAIGLGLALPCALLAATLITALAIGLSPALSIGVTLAVLTIYYLILALNRQAIATRIHWSITPSS